MAVQRVCPGAEALAAFVDGGLPAAEREPLVAHLADCDACRHLVAEVLLVQDAIGAAHPTFPARPPVVTEGRAPRWTLPGTRVMAWAVVATAAVALVPMLLLEMRPGRFAEVGSLAGLTEAPREERGVEPRLTGGFSYAPLQAPSRAAGDSGASRAPWRLVAAAGELRDGFRHDITAHGRHAVGVAALLVDDHDEAVRALAEAAAIAKDDARILSDLAAAYHERARVGGRPDDLPRALDAAERAVAADPSLVEARFNRALIITAFNLRDQAIDAWRAYLALDDSSGWAAEARRHLETLEQPTAADEWPAVRDALLGDERPTPEMVDAAVRRHASRTRELIEQVLLARWAEAVQHGGQGETELARVRELADAFARLAGDPFLNEVVASIRQAQAKGDVALGPVVAAHVVFSRGMTRFSEVGFAESRADLFEARAALQAVGSPLALRAAVRLAAIVYYAGQFAEAESELARIEVDARSNGYVDLVGHATWLRGMAAFSLGRLGEAQYFYEQSLEAFSALGDQEQVASANGRLATLFFYIGDWQRAWTYRTTSLKALNAVESYGGRYRLVASAATDVLSADTPAAALVFQTAALTEVSAWGSPGVVLEARIQRARILHQLGRDELAIRELAEVQQAFEGVDDALVRERMQLRLLMAQAETLSASSPAAALDAALEAQTLAVVKADQIRASELNLLVADAYEGLGRATEAEQAIGAGIEIFEVQRQALSDEGRLAYTARSWALFDRGIRLALDRGDRDKAFALSERGRARSLVEARQWSGTRLASIDALQGSLDSKSALVVLNQFDDELVVWVLRDTGTTLTTARISRERARAMVAGHVAELEGELEHAPRSAALYDAVIRPLEPALKGTTSLVFVPDAPYYQVSFGALFDQTRRRFVVEDYAVSVAPSATVYQRASARARTFGQAPRSALVLGAPVTTAGEAVAVLRGAGREAGAVAALYPAGELRAGLMATPARLLDDGPNRDVVHVAAHATSNARFPLLSRVLLADAPGKPYSGALFSRDIAAREFSDTRLVVLATCDAATGLEMRGEGTLGLARAFLAAGVPAVVGTLGLVDDADGERLFVDFHRRYARGAPAADALRQAQLQALRSTPGRLGTWARIVLFGAGS